MKVLLIIASAIAATVAFTWYCVSYDHVWIAWFILYVVLLHIAALKWGGMWATGSIIVAALVALLGCGFYLMHPASIGSAHTWALMVSFVLIADLWRVKVVADRYAAKRRYIAEMNAKVIPLRSHQQLKVN